MARTKAIRATSGELACIEVRGAAEHNLRQVDLDIPKKQLVVFTGPSGSGKSSLAFGTVFAEGQRRYVESLSAYARQFLGQLDKPKYESIRGLAPTIAIEQKAAARNPRSTVGTITEILDYLRVLWARIGHQHCPGCGQAVGRQTLDEMVATILRLPAGTRFLVLAPKILNRKGEYAELFDRARKSGFTRVRVDGEVRELDAPIALARNLKHTIELVVDRLVVKPDLGSRLADSVEIAMREGGGKLIVSTVPTSGQGQDIFFSDSLHCHTCDRSFPDLEPNRFSFNSPLGMCPECNGLGTRAELDEGRLIPDPGLSIGAGAVDPWGAIGDPDRHGWHIKYRRELLRQLGIPLDVPWRELSDEARQTILHGAGRRVRVAWTTRHGEGHFDSLFDGVIPWLERQRKEGGEERAVRLAHYYSDHPCRACQGGRLEPVAAAVRLGGLTLPEAGRLTIAGAVDFFGRLPLAGAEAAIAGEVLREVRNRLRFLVDVGLDYLTLDRSGPSLSGGEAQRIRLASQVGSELTGVIYVLDEPSIGLHQRDNRRLIGTLAHLRDLGNTVVVVEHDEETIRSADHVVDFGPGAGRLGGEVVYAGPVAGLTKAKRSLTGDYLAGRRSIPVPARRRPGNGHHLLVRGARANNLQNIDVAIPLGTLTCLTGVSGAGKSSLLNGILYPALANHFHEADRTVGPHDRIEGLEHLDKVISIDQQPIGRTPRSNPATYTKVWDGIRQLFATTREARLAGYGPSRFSFNVKGGRCEACSGDGIRKVEMHFLADVYVPCEVCHGARFNEATLRVHFKDRNIAQILDTSVAEALELFNAHPTITAILQTLADVGLDYIHLGQSATTLSGGEAQRIKLSRELARRATGSTLYILDEPSTGLHFEDVRKLLGVLDRLVEDGNTVVVIEHHLDIIKCADHLIDLGPEGGAGGGRIVAAGTPEAVARVKASHTGRHLASMI